MMEAAAAALAGSLLCPRAFWQRVSGPQEERLLKQMSYGLVVFISLAVVFVLHRAGAPYGRYYSASYGRSVPATLAWMVQEMPAFLFPLQLVLGSDGDRLRFWPNRILLGLFLVHYFYRSFIFPFLIRGGKPTPFITFVLAFSFCLYNGYLQGRSLSNYAEYSPNRLTEPYFILGGMFEYVSGANYFGEILEWCGFALACNTLESTAFAVSTLLVLGSRAHMHHQWYLNKFEDYPRSRKIVIPFVF
ncbi:3-oxo-5-alpha-steroid 4-dehydrogenase 1 isoform X2 [Candoia aspera]|uniref:3-oxo-5-alpha-steroid 4-dehydrogenase 1 isoform X2 n=1 Tax=Candoia aspera TaxID=51853 RepID=UPI002FD7F525